MKNLKMMNNVINIALSEYGVKEVPGEKDNPRILQYFEEIGHSWVKDEQTAWCSAFVNWVMKKANKRISGKLNARSWLKVGVETVLPDKGDVVVLWREDPKSWKGHVAFFIRQSKDHVYLLGGNQSNAVSIVKYPKSRVLSYRKI